MKFTFYHYDRWRYTLFLLLPFILFIPVVVIIFSLKQNAALILLLLAVILFWILAMYLPKKLARASIEATVTEDKLIFDWIKPAWKTRSKTITIYFKEIVSYKYEFSSNLYLFKLKQTNRSILKIYSQFDDDDFDRFYDYFKKIVADLNLNPHVQPIIREKGLNEKLGYLISMTTLFGFGFIGTLYLTLFRNEDDPKKIFGVIILAVLFISFLIRTISIIRKTI